MTRTGAQSRVVAEGGGPDESLFGSVTFDDVRSASERVEGVVKRTPVVTSRTLDELVGASVFLKCECLQRVGAFKIRGAYNAMSRLGKEERPRGVLAYSSGNHAQGVALAAALLDIRATIVMPTNAPPAKLAATRAYLERAPEGSEVVEYDPATIVREELGGRLAEERGLTIVPPFDHPHVIAGQGTAALELIEDVGPLDALWTPCGGGGLLSGSAVAGKGMLPDLEVVGVEPELGDDVTRSYETGRLHAVAYPQTIADGARTTSPGRYTFALVRAHADGMRTVSDAELAAATLLCLERLRLVVEPTGALAIAGLIREGRSNPEGVRGRRIGAIISGGNIDPGMIPRLQELAATAG
ncbi:MAG: pyridoxal-phosphate dependent enzyme [Phycisphaerales bacterium]